MAEPLLIAKNDKTKLFILPQMANRHGLITGATGTGKTVTLQTMAEAFFRHRRAVLHVGREGRSVRHFAAGRQQSQSGGARGKAETRRL